MPDGPPSLRHLTKPEQERLIEPIWIADTLELARDDHHVEIVRITIPAYYGEGAAYLDEADATKMRDWLTAWLRWRGVEKD